MSFLIKVQTALALGPSNIVRVGVYQLGLKRGLHPVLKITPRPIKGDFYRQTHIPEAQINNIESPSPTQGYRFEPFGCLNPISIDDMCWDKSVLTDKQFSPMHAPWFNLSDFDSDVGDIKGVWETSRFDWTLGLAKAYLSGQEPALEELNSTILRWVEQNPAYLGPNWKCGQEASIRVMHLAMTAKLLNQVDNTEPALITLVANHLQRIAPTLSYALAQDNNHGTSEAAALFIGGSWLSVNGNEQGKKWAQQGRKWLEERAKRLILSDGAFSQYSVVYHRVMLDTYSMAEIWRRELHLESFSSQLIERVGAATQWLYQIVDASTGDAPNLGANDGARLLPLTDTDYRDFRPSVQLASVLFLDKAAWSEDGAYDEVLSLMILSKPKELLRRSSSFHHEHGGYIGLRNDNDAFVLFNYPKFRFRPSQNDALHVDLWCDGVNLLRDGGTFSYNAGQKYIDYYGGTASHNTIQFNDHEQMPRLSRFLLGAWLKAKNVQFNAQELIGQAGYKDYLGCIHHREVSLTETTLTVKDQFSGFKNKAVLRWRLSPGHWQLQGQSVTNGCHTLTINTDLAINRMQLVEGRESRYYYQENPIPVLEIEVSTSGTIITEYQFNS